MNTAGKVSNTLEDFWKTASGKSLNTGRPLVMGIINLTPDSFYENSRAEVGDDFIHRVGKMLEDGMDILDIGAVSTRPGSEDPGLQAEMDRLLPALSLLRKCFPELCISVDTFRADVAGEALRIGVSAINDISAGGDDDQMLKVIAGHNVPYIMMHKQGMPAQMQEKPHYDDVLLDISEFFRLKIEKFNAFGIKKIILDPGFGFGKTLEHNYQLLAGLSHFKSFGYPILAGISRKSMLYRLLDITPEEAMNASSVANTLALYGGADILRVHDVKQAREVVEIFSMYKRFLHD
ncbi:MAG: dihydropteroate synthase [Bacteroidales bacterium]|jgi:dihydropteroate synthase|nr:dihydropteroate synthase [Bacteroidales bacterium]